MTELHNLEIPRFSKNNRNTYGDQIIATLKQVLRGFCNPLCSPLLWWQDCTSEGC